MQALGSFAPAALHFRGTRGVRSIRAYTLSALCAEGNAPPWNMIAVVPPQQVRNVCGAGPAPDVKIMSQAVALHIMQCDGGHVMIGLV